MPDWQRIELHNHTDESDGRLSPAELHAFFEREAVPAFALTDHNTCSAPAKLRGISDARRRECEPIPGLEFTTWFGHVLCFGDVRYQSWHDLDPDQPEAWLSRLRGPNVKLGIAHPFAANHTRNRFVIRDWSVFDLVEIVNNANDFEAVNLPALRLWESLVMRGVRLAATSGMDLHAPRPLAGCFTTFIPTAPDGANAAIRLQQAIAECRTIVTRGPLLTACRERGTDVLVVRLEAGTEPVPEAGAICLVVRTPAGTQVHAWENPTEPLLVPLAGLPAVVRVHGCAVDAEERERDLGLLAVAPPVWG